ncbi:tyrosine-type recombinase/integrase [Neobacillus drentensis]|uniref:tyrosine-type recombinase/integrase n=1 Tax=Neobacillus drentensis TaxID=220684 RepID=UPI002FFE3E5D
MRKHGRTATDKRAVREEFSMGELYEKFMWYKRAEGLAPRTLEEYELHFRWFIDYLKGDIPKEQMVPELFLKYFHYMAHERELAPYTVNIRTMRAFLRWCYLEEHIDTPIHEKLKLVKTEEDKIEALTVVEIKSLLNAFDTTTYVGFRDKVMVMVLLDTMVRISELLSIKRSNVDLKEGTIKLEAPNTKTRKGRTVPISKKTAKLLKEYMTESEDFGEELLFLTYDGREMVSNTWRTRLHEVADLSGVKKAVRPHILRHIGALLYIMNGGDPFSLQKILGHTTMEMTRKYIQMTDVDIRKQHNFYSPLKGI